MAYTIRATRTGFVIHKEGVIWNQVGGVSARDYKGLKKAKKDADKRVSTYANKKDYIVTKIPNTYIYGIFHRTNRGI